MLNLGYKVSSTVWPHESSRAWDQTTGALHAGGMNWEPIHGSHWLSSFSIHNLNQIHVVVLNSDHGSQVEGANWIKLDRFSPFFLEVKISKNLFLKCHSNPNYPRKTDEIADVEIVFWSLNVAGNPWACYCSKPTSQGKSSASYNRCTWGSKRCQFQLQFHGLPGTCGAQGELQISLTLVLKGFQGTPSILGFGFPCLPDLVSVNSFWVWKGPYFVCNVVSRNLWSDHQKMISRTFVLPPGHQSPKTNI